MRHMWGKKILRQCRKQKKDADFSGLTEKICVRNSRSGALEEIKHPTAQTERSETRGHQERSNQKEEASVKMLKQVSSCVKVGQLTSAVDRLSSRIIKAKLKR